MPENSHVVYCHIKRAFFLTLYAFTSCFRTLATSANNSVRNSIARPREKPEEWRPYLFGPQAEGKCIRVRCFPYFPYHIAWSFPREVRTEPQGLVGVGWGRGLVAMAGMEVGVLGSHVFSRKLNKSTLFSLSHCMELSA